VKVLAIGRGLSESQRAFLASTLVHSGIVFIFAILFFLRAPKTVVYDLPVVIENPKVQATPTLKVSEAVPRPDPKKKVEKVFGASRRAVEDQRQGLQVKVGNTLATEVDTKTLSKEDEDLPIPTDEYLVSSMPAVLSEIRIPYPPEARKQGVEGPVVMDLLIDAEGKLRDLRLISGPAESLNQAALQAVRNFRFRAARVGDKSVAVRIRYVYRFVLEK